MPAQPLRRQNLRELENPPTAKSAEAIKNPLPADKSAPQTITVNGKTLHYTATVGTITLKGKDDKPTGVVMYTAFTLGTKKRQPKGKKQRQRQRLAPAGHVRAQWWARSLVRLSEPGRDRAEAYCVCE